MKKVGQIIEKVFESSALNDQFKIYRIMYYWPTIAGEKIAQYSYIAKIENNIMYIVVNNAPFMQQIRMQANILIHKVNTFIGMPLVSKIVTKTGPMRKVKMEEDPINDLGEHLPFDKLKISECKLQEIRATVAHIKDKVLQESLIQLAIATYKREYYVKKLGLKTCPICSLYIDKEEDICVVCKWKAYRKKIGHIKKVILEKPDMNYKECLERISCSRDDYYTAKDECIVHYKSLNNCDHPDLECMYILTMLLTGKTRESLSVDSVKRYAEKYRQTYY